MDGEYKVIDQQYVAKYVTKVYGWMFLALTITAAVAFFTVTNPTILAALIKNPFIFFGLFLGQILLVGYLSLRVQKMSVGTATFIFLAYAALTGLTISTIFLRYSGATLMSAFGTTAVTFGVMSLIGYFTKQDLTSFGRIMLMALVGVIIASIVNIFLGSSMLYWIISYVGVAVFVGLIAYDTQKIKALALLDSEEARQKGAIMGALTLYLDFINLFLMLLRIFGRRD
nr:Bax inhibitor-1/YccA family protein [Edaphocola flava]